MKARAHALPFPDVANFDAGIVMMLWMLSGIALVMAMLV
jgi:hypothetical protein